ncbi:MAG: oligosaccharide flippase family protein [Agriterribacter sp.]
MTLPKRLKAVFKSDFNKNFLVLFSGSTISQVIPLAVSVILARIYSQEDFGVLAVFNGMVLIFTSMANLRYEFAIPLPTEDKDAVGLSFLSAFVALGISILLFLIILLFKNPILNLIGGEKLNNWIFLVPLAAFLGGLYNALNYFSLRFKQYKTIASSNILRSSSNAGLQLGFGLLGFKHAGLILGNLFSSFFGNARMIKHFFTYKHLFRFVNKQEMKKLAIRYKKFPLISVWGIFLNSLSVNTNNFFIPKIYGIGQLGLYSFGYRYLSIPLSLIGSNMGQLFYQVSSDCYKSNKPATKEFLSTLRKLLYICGPFFLILFFVIENAFAFVFGEKWRIAGTYSQILLPLFLVRTLFAPLSVIAPAFEKQGMALMMQVAIFLANVLSFVYAYVTKCDMQQFLYIYTYFGLAVYSFLLFILYRIAAQKI